MNGNELSDETNWIISRIPHRISKNIFAKGSYESLSMLEGKTRKGNFFHSRSKQRTDQRVLVHTLKFLALKNCFFMFSGSKRIHFFNKKGIIQLFSADAIVFSKKN